MCRYTYTSIQTNTQLFEIWFLEMVKVAWEMTQTVMGQKEKSKSKRAWKWTKIRSACWLKGCWLKKKRWFIMAVLNKLNDIWSQNFKLSKKLGTPGSLQHLERNNAFKSLHCLFFSSSSITLYNISALTIFLIINKGKYVLLKSHSYIYLNMFVVINFYEAINKKRKGEMRQLILFNYICIIILSKCWQVLTLKMSFQ